MAHVTIQVPTPLRPFAGGQREVAVEGTTVGGLVRQLAEMHPGLQRHLFAPDGRLRSFVTLYLNDEDVRYLKKDATPVRDGDVVSIVPAIAGGSQAKARSVLPGTRARPEPPSAAAFTSEELRRYSRHLLLPEDRKSVV